MIAVKQMTKLYGNGRGVRDLAFEIKKGEVFGYLGPNGAGKTTTIRNLLGFLHPNQGSCTIGGLDCWKDAEKIQENLGYIPGEIAFINGMTGIGFLNLIADMRKTKGRSRMKQLLDLFQLDPSGKIRRMSKGMKQKLGIVAACMHDPAIMIFDEPSAGLDPLMRNLFVDFILKEKERGKTLLISSHSFDEIDRTCDRAGIIREGILVDVKDIHELKEKQRRAIIVTVPTEKELEQLKNSKIETGFVDNLRIEMIIQGKMDHFVKTISQVTVENLEVQSLTLEQVFMQYYGKEADR